MSPLPSFSSPSQSHAASAAPRKSSQAAAAVAVPSSLIRLTPLLLGGLQANLTPILLPTSTSPTPTTTTLTPTTPTSTALNPNTTTLTPGSTAAGATPGSLSGASALPGGGASVVTLLVNAANGTLGFALPWAQGAGENVQAGIYTVGDMLNDIIWGENVQAGIYTVGDMLNASRSISREYNHAYNHMLTDSLSLSPLLATRSTAPPHTASSPRLVLPLMGMAVNSTPAVSSATRATSASSSSTPLDPLTAAAAGVAGALAGLGTSAAGVTAGPGVTAAPGVSSGGMAGSGGASGITAGPRAAAGATGAGEAAPATSTAPVTQGPRRGLSGTVANPVAAAAGAAQGAVQGAVGGAVGAVQGVVQRGSGWLWGAVPVPGAALVNILRNPGQYQLRLSVGNGADAASFAGRLVVSGMQNPR
ncbi:unnamed protein product [Closterium sp. Naga37s-1]|nr:unnamed protein product [Closterium sp. Naga37s-1]